jgi:hypothetical protein
MAAEILKLTAAGVTPRHCALQPRHREDPVDPTLSGALAPVLRDLGHSGSLMPEGTHPLMAAVREGRAVWICPRTGDLVSDVGRLRAPDG